ncbi:RNA-guided pseudouridylation complex pseudouridine synthase subunit Cbf5 [Candidatus Pacearchaeota archaeon]|nr:RNA-guided pseudouridylation complex pseudouridine synthase subunit Cbf5 [Candidatus Pacearchaeota archaeon]
MDIEKIKSKKTIGENTRFSLADLKKNKSTKELLEFGIINIDKPSGPTSFNVSDFVRKSLGLRKTSHFGTLDPKVTGVLPVALNRACKLTGYFLGEDKEYVGIMRIHKDVSLDKIKKVIKEKFTGKILQTPPVKSRVKRQEREREIKKFELIEKSEKNILFRAEVEGGTYIRKLIDDLGKELGVGAHMLELRRVRAGIFLEDNAKYPSVNLYDFERAVEEYKKEEDKLLRKIIIPGEIISELHPIVEIKKDRLQQIFTGKPIYEKDLVKNVKIEHHRRTPKNLRRRFLLGAKDKIIIVFCENKFVGIYKTILGEHIFAKSEFVMQP